MTRPATAVRAVPPPRTAVERLLAVPPERRQAAASLLAALLTALVLTALAAVAVGHGVERVALEVVGVAEGLDPRSAAGPVSAASQSSASLAGE